jgi:hypothetical protein
MHGSFPAVQVQKNLWTAIPNAVLPTRSMLRDLSGFWARDHNRGNLREIFQAGSVIGNQTGVTQTVINDVLTTAAH